MKSSWNLSKLEYIIDSTIWRHALTTNLLNVAQFGFCRDCSAPELTFDSVIKLTFRNCTCLTTPHQRSNWLIENGTRNSGEDGQGASKEKYVRIWSHILHKRRWLRLIAINYRISCSLWFLSAVSWPNYFQFLHQQPIIKSWVALFIDNCIMLLPFATLQQMEWSLQKDLDDI